MNDFDRADLRRLKERQAALLQQLQNLGRDIAALESRLAQPAKVPEPQAQQPVPLEPVPLHVKPPEPPPAPQPAAPPPPVISPPPHLPEIARPAAPRVPPPIPGPIVPAVAQTQTQPSAPKAPQPGQTQAAAASSGTATMPTLPGQRRQEQQSSRAGAPPPTSPPPPKSTAAPAPSPKESSLELRVGTVWLVRFGIVMVLTALGLFGAYAYQNLIPHVGPGGKVGMLYFTSFALLGVGTWLHRKDEKLRNYANVLVAGGLAAVYFTTFAAHYFNPLQVIRSAVIDGALLFVWAAFIVWLADRKKSEIVAIIAVLGAYYASALAHAELFTLFSNLVLTLAAVFFLIRNRWATLSFASLAGTYAGYAFWRFYRGSHLEWPTEDIWPGNAFLLSYWIVFTAAVFLSKHAEWDERKRASFLSLNNGAFFTAFLLTMWNVHQQGFWKFSLVYGAVLLGLTFAARRLRPDEKIFRNTYLTQGLVLVTLGFVIHYVGRMRLGLILAAESVTLVVLGQQVKNRVMQIASYAAGALAVALTIPHIDALDHKGLVTGAALGAAMLFNAFWLRKETDYDNSTRHPQTVFFTLLTLAMWIITSWQNATQPWRPLIFAVQSTLVLLTARPLGNRVLSAGSMTFAAIAAACQSANFVAAYVPAGFPFQEGLWRGALTGAFLLFNATWYRRETTWEQSGRHPQTVFFTTLALLICIEVTKEHTSEHWCALAWAVESSLFLALAFPLRNQALAFGSWVLAILAVAMQSLDFVDQYQTLRLAQRLGWPQGVAIGALMLGNAIWSQRVQTRPKPADRMFAPPVTLFCSLALIAWLGVTWVFVGPNYVAPVMAAEALLFTVSFYALQLTEITLFGQAFLLLAQLLWIVESGAQAPPRPWWNPATVIALSLAVSAWWQRQKTVDLRAEFRQLLQGLYAFAVVGLLFGWLHPRLDAGDWLAMASMLALILTAYGVIARYWLLAAAGQILLVVSAWEFVRQLLSVKPLWYFPLTPVFVLVALSIGTVQWFERRPDADPDVSRPLLNISLMYRAVALVMSLWWVYEYIDAREQCWVLGLAGLLLFGVAGMARSLEALIFSGVFSLSAMVRFWWPEEGAPALYWPNLVVLLGLLGQQRASKHWPERLHVTQELHAGTMVVVATGIWRYLYLWVGAHATGSFYQTASWSLLALFLFVLGMTWRERVYRWLGLGVLACALARVVVIDIWSLQRIYQVMSFMALGVVLLGLGFLYNRYQERIKEWL